MPAFLTLGWASRVTTRRNIWSWNWRVTAFLLSLPPIVKKFWREKFCKLSATTLIWWKFCEVNSKHSKHFWKLKYFVVNYFLLFRAILNIAGPHFQNDFFSSLRGTKESTERCVLGRPVSTSEQSSPALTRL